MKNPASTNGQARSDQDAGLWISRTKSGHRCQDPAEGLKTNTRGNGSEGALRLSEAIRLGATMRPQAFRTLVTDDGACALGAALLAVGARPEEAVRSALNRWPWASTVNADCPGCGRSRTVFRVITHLNDRHRWTREQIAKWVAGIEPTDVLRGQAPVRPSSGRRLCPLDRVPGQPFGTLVDHEEWPARAFLSAWSPRATRRRGLLPNDGLAWQEVRFAGIRRERRKSLWAHIARVHSYRVTPPRSARSFRSYGLITTVPLSSAIGGRSPASRTRGVGSRSWRPQRRHIVRSIFSCPGRPCGTSVRSSSSIDSSYRVASRSVSGISWASSCGSHRRCRPVGQGP